MELSERDPRELLDRHGQEHVLRFWSDLDADARQGLLAQIVSIDFRLMNRLIEKWVLNDPPLETFDVIRPVPVIPKPEPGRSDAQEAWQTGEAALRAGRVGLFLVAGGQGTRLGFPGPKGAYPIGPVSGRSLFAFHAEKIHNIQRRYGCVLPWYIMVSDANDEETRAFFQEHDFFGLDKGAIKFFRQRMVPCVDEQGKFMLEEPGRLAMNPNGHGGCIPAMVENHVLDDARRRGVDLLSYFQVDNWAVRLADPYLLGYHVLRHAQMSSKVHRKNEPREAVGVHCLCDGEYRVIEYSALDIYPQLLETDGEGNVVYFAGNPAMHVVSVDFVGDVYDRYDEFPWWRAHKKIPRVNDSGETVKPDKPNGYKFETFVFDALRFVNHAPVALEIERLGEYTPIKQFEGPNSVAAARMSMRKYWGQWLEAAGCALPREAKGDIAVDIEISPQFALYKEELVEKTRGWDWPKEGPIAVSPKGELFRHAQ